MIVRIAAMLVTVTVASVVCFFLLDAAMILITGDIHNGVGIVTVAVLSIAAGLVSADAVGKRIDRRQQQPRPIDLERR